MLGFAHYLILLCFFFLLLLAKKVLAHPVYHSHHIDQFTPYDHHVLVNLTLKYIMMKPLQCTLWHVWIIQFLFECYNVELIYNTIMTLYAVSLFFMYANTLCTCGHVYSCY